MIFLERSFSIFIAAYNWQIYQKINQSISYSINVNKLSMTIMRLIRLLKPFLIFNVLFLDFSKVRKSRLVY